MPDAKRKKHKKIAKPEEMVALRNAVGHTQEAAADFLYVSLRTYQNWEYGISKAPLAFYEFYELKAITRGLLPVKWAVEKRERLEKDKD